MMGWHCQFKKNKSPLIFAGPETRVETLICGNFPKLNVKPANKIRSLLLWHKNLQNYLGAEGQKQNSWASMFHDGKWREGTVPLDCPLHVPLEPGTYVTTQPACLLSQTPPLALSPPVRLGVCISGDEWLPGCDLLLALNSGPPRIFHSAPFLLNLAFSAAPHKGYWEKQIMDWGCGACHTLPGVYSLQLCF